MALKIDDTWTLFIDRDGVINEEKKDSYIYTWSEFKFYNGVLEAMKIFNSLFSTIIMVTNQRGVGKGYMSLNDLETIHTNMLLQIKINGGRIDKIFYCTDVESNSPNRKPNIGMALQAQQQFSHINFSKSIMIGNRMSDMQFGKNAGMTTVYLNTTHANEPDEKGIIDYRFDDLLQVALSLKKQ